MAWVEGRVLERIEWTPTLFSLRVAAELAPYKAGQFTKLALEQGERRVQRAYSFVNPPSAPYHEFYFVEIPDGELTPSLGSLQAGDSLLVQSLATGFLTLDEVPAGRDLWLLSTGTAIGPFLSMLADGEAFAKVDPSVARTPGSEQIGPEEVQARLLAGGDLPLTAAGGSKPACSPLMQDEMTYRERKIEEMYVASRNNCDVIFASVNDAAKRSSCYNNVAAEKTRRQANMPMFPECNPQ